MRRTRQTKKEVRAILYSEMPTIIDDETGEARTMTDQELADMHGTHIYYRGNNRVMALCCGMDDAEWPGSSVCGKIGLYGPARRKLAFDAMKGKPPSDPSKVQVNHGFDAMAIAKLPEEFPRTDPETGEAIPAVSLTEFERFEHRMPKIFGDD